MVQTGHRSQSVDSAGPRLRPSLRRCRERHRRLPLPLPTPEQLRAECDFLAPLQQNLTTMRLGRLRVSIGLMGAVEIGR